MKLRSSLVGISIVVTGLAMQGCESEGPGGASGSGETGAPSCASSGKRICARACACAGGTECKTGIPNAFGTFTTLTWSDLADCEAGYAASRCKDGGSPAVDYAACTTTVDSAACSDDVFVVPTGCEAPRDAG